MVNQFFVVRYTSILFTLIMGTSVFASSVAIIGRVRNPMNLSREALARLQCYNQLRACDFQPYPCSASGREQDIRHVSAFEFKAAVYAAGAFRHINYIFSSYDKFF